MTRPALSKSWKVVTAVGECPISTSNRQRLAARGTRKSSGIHGMRVSRLTYFLPFRTLPMGPRVWSTIQELDFRQALNTDSSWPTFAAASPTAAWPLSAGARRSGIQAGRVRSIPLEHSGDRCRLRIRRLLLCARLGRRLGQAGQRPNLSSLPSRLPRSRIRNHSLARGWYREARYHVPLQTAPPSGYANTSAGSVRVGISPKRIERSLSKVSNIHRAPVGTNPFDLGPRTNLSQRSLLSRLDHPVARRQGSGDPCPGSSHVGRRSRCRSVSPTRCASGRRESARSILLRDRTGPHRQQRGGGPFTFDDREERGS